MLEERRNIRYFLMLLEDAAAFLDRGDDRSEVVVGQRHGRRFLGDVGAGDAHGDADVGLACRAGASLTPSPVMATTCRRLPAAP